jgi:hypothetical protein
MEAVRALGPADRPDYAGYRRLFRAFFLEREFVYDYRSDWATVRGQLSFVFDSRVVLKPSKLMPERRANSFQKSVAAHRALYCHRRSDPRDAKPGPFGTGRALRPRIPTMGVGVVPRPPRYE